MSKLQNERLKKYIEAEEAILSGSLTPSETARSQGRTWQPLNGSFRNSSRQGRP